MRKKQLLKLKKEECKEKNPKHKLKERLLQIRFFYRVAGGLKDFKGWFDNLSNTTIIITVLLTVIFLNLLFSWITPHFTIDVQNFSEVKNKAFRVVNGHIYLALLLYIATFIIRIWSKYSKKPIGNVMQ